jgi:osmotically-inducible protein OsmY
MAACLMVAGCAGLGSQFQESPEDQQMTRAVKAALVADRTPTLDRVNVSTSGGRVMLTGWANLAGAQRARDIAAGVAGAGNVVDLIQVPSSDGR